jgi:hypothetical protein
MASSLKVETSYLLLYSNWEKGIPYLLLFMINRCEQETSWYREGMHAPVSRWRKAVDVDGDYVEK